MNAEHRDSRRCGGGSSATRSVDALVVTGASNMAYLTGLRGRVRRGINAACLVTPRDRAASTPTSATGGRRRPPRRARRGSSASREESLYVELCEDLRAEGVEPLALESSVPYGRFKFISPSSSSGRSRSSTDGWRTSAQVKEPHEIERIEAAAAAHRPRVRAHPRRRSRPGMTEREIALELEFFMRREGSEGVAFPPIVASGPNSARPHAQVTRPRARSGRLREARLRRARRRLLRGHDAHRRGRRGVRAPARDLRRRCWRRTRPGIAAVAAGAAGARRRCRGARGHRGARASASCFGHGLGHGVGLDVHELPERRARGATRARSARHASSPSSRASTCPVSAVLESRTWWSWKRPEPRVLDPLAEGAHRAVEPPLRGRA